MATGEFFGFFRGLFHRLDWPIYPEYSPGGVLTPRQTSPGNDNTAPGPNRLGIKELG